MNEYLKGAGLDVSRRPYLLSKGIEVKNKFVEPNNLYSLRKFSDYESLDFIYSHMLINETKFFKILLKEWFNFTKVKGHIMIEMVPNRILNFDQLISECKLLFNNKMEIIEQKNAKGICTLVIKKTKPSLKKGDSIDKWTFGIITDGKRKEWVDAEVDSIINLNIPNFEIIICGNYYPKGRKNVKFIDFKPKVSWITKKKNLICQKAKYENLVITHDRFIFDKNWYNGMKKYGNYYDVLCCVIKGPSGERADDWITYGLNKNEPIANLGYLDYRDWDINGYISGGFYIMKKSVWEKCKWNEALVWGQAEDLELSREFLKQGFVARFNPFSIIKSLSYRGKWITFKYDTQKHITLSDRPFVAKIKYYTKQIAKKYVLR